MIEENCRNRADLCPICPCEDLCMCLFVFPTSLTINFANVLNAFAQILEARGDVLCHGTDTEPGELFQALIPVQILPPSLKWKNCGNGWTDSSLLEPLVLASATAQGLSQLQSLSWGVWWTQGKMRKKCRDGHTHVQLEMMWETLTFQKGRVCFWGDNLEDVEQEVKRTNNYSSILGWSCRAISFPLGQGWCNFAFAVPAEGCGAVEEVAAPV